LESLGAAATLKLARRELPRGLLHLTAAQIQIRPDATQQKEYNKGYHNTRNDSRLFAGLGCRRRSFGFCGDCSLIPAAANQPNTVHIRGTLGFYNRSSSGPPTVATQSVSLEKIK
jgi:hypothetical protein